MKKILHISNDDKFISIGKTIFDAVEGTTNEFWIIPDSAKLAHATFADRNLYGEDFNTPEYHNRINSFDVVCIHFLNPKLYPLLESKAISKPILWIGWGGDYYWLLDTYKGFDLFRSKTQKEWVNNIKGIDILNPIIKKLKKITRGRKLNTINQITYFAPVNRLEYKMIKNNYPKFSPKFIDWNYGYLTQDVIQHYKSFHRKGNNIMIGNSATPTNNHLDIFHDLGTLLANEQLILPLNYGDNNYAQYIAKAAHEQFGENIELLQEYIPTSEFDKLLLSCKTLIIGSYRQQAVGTIISALYFGINVFLYEESLNYKFFKQHNFHIFSITELKKSPYLLDDMLNPELIEENRSKINELWSLHKNVKSIEMILKNVEGI